MGLPVAAMKNLAYFELGILKPIVFLSRIDVIGELRIFRHWQQDCQWTRPEFINYCFVDLWDRLPSNILQMVR